MGVTLVLVVVKLGLGLDRGVAFLFFNLLG